MPPTQTQSLPTWASTYYHLPSPTCTTVDACKPAASTDEDPLYLSGEETDCDSERSSDTLTREDEQVMTKFIQLHRERACKQVPDVATGPPGVVRATPVLIPLQSRKYVATSTKRWLWDDDNDNDNEDADADEAGANEDGSQCASDERWPGPLAVAADVVALEAKEISASDLIFDFDL